MTDTQHKKADAVKESTRIAEGLGFTYLDGQKGNLDWLYDQSQKLHALFEVEEIQWYLGRLLAMAMQSDSFALLEKHERENFGDLVNDINLFITLFYQVDLEFLIEYLKKCK